MLTEHNKNVLQKLAPLIALVLISIVLTFLSPDFLTLNNILNVMRQVSINALIAFGMTFVILTGGIDLSVGSILALSSVLIAGWITAGMDPVLATLLAHPAMREWESAALAEDFRDPPHEDELAQIGRVTADLRVPAR